MNKLGAILLYGGGLVFAGLLVYASFSIGGGNTGGAVKVIADEEGEKWEIKQADKIEVFLFHTTHRCHTCVTIGQYAKKTVEQEFPEEMKSGKIEFREINIDLPENKELAAKYRAGGSALFLNPIVGGVDNIEEDTKVWMLTSNEQAFIDYLAGKLKAWL